jgi:hypothetical protein
VNLVFDVADQRVRRHQGQPYLIDFLRAHEASDRLCYRFEVHPEGDGLLTVYEYDPVIFDNSVPLDPDNVPVREPYTVPLRIQLPPELLAKAAA